MLTYVAGWLDEGRREGEGKEGEREKEREERRGKGLCPLMQRESHGVPDWRKMSKDCSSG